MEIRYLFKAVDDEFSDINKAILFWKICLCYRQTLTFRIIIITTKETNICMKTVIA